MKRGRDESFGDLDERPSKEAKTEDSEWFDWDVDTSSSRPTPIATPWHETKSVPRAAVSPPPPPVPHVEVHVQAQQAQVETQSSSPTAATPSLSAEDMKRMRKEKQARLQQEQMLKRQVTADVTSLAMDHKNVPVFMKPPPIRWPCGCGSPDSIPTAARIPRSESLTRFRAVTITGIVYPASLMSSNMPCNAKFCISDQGKPVYFRGSVSVLDARLYRYTIHGSLVEQNENEQEQYNRGRYQAEEHKLYNIVHHSVQPVEWSAANGGSDLAKHFVHLHRFRGVDGDKNRRDAETTLCLAVDKFNDDMRMRQAVERDRKRAADEEAKEREVLGLDLQEMAAEEKAKAAPAAPHQPKSFNVAKWLRQKAVDDRIPWALELLNSSETCAFLTLLEFPALLDWYPLKQLCKTNFFQRERLRVLVSAGSPLTLFMMPNLPNYSESYDYKDLVAVCAKQERVRKTAAEFDQAKSRTKNKIGAFTMARWCDLSEFPPVSLEWLANTYTRSRGAKGEIDEDSAARQIAYMLFNFGIGCEAFELIWLVQLLACDQKISRDTMTRVRFVPGGETKTDSKSMPASAPFIGCKPRVEFKATAPSAAGAYEFATFNMLCKVGSRIRGYLFSLSNTYESADYFFAERDQHDVRYGWEATVDTETCLQNESAIRKSNGRWLGMLASMGIVSVQSLRDQYYVAFSYVWARCANWVFAFKRYLERWQQNRTALSRSVRGMVLIDKQLEKLSRTQEQLRVLDSILNCPVVLETGEPGTGKSSIFQCFVPAMEEKRPPGDIERQRMAIAKASGLGLGGTAIGGGGGSGGGGGGGSGGGGGGSGGGGGGEYKTARKPPASLEESACGVPLSFAMPLAFASKPLPFYKVRQLEQEQEEKRKQQALKQEQKQQKQQTAGTGSGGGGGGGDNRVRVYSKLANMFVMGQIRRVSVRNEKRFGITGFTLDHIQEFCTYARPDEIKERLSECVVIAIDEIGTVDEEKFCKTAFLFDEVPNLACLMYIGDENQLNPVGPGHPLRALMSAHRYVKHCKLTQNMRVSPEHKYLRQIVSGILRHDISTIGNLFDMRAQVQLVQYVPHKRPSAVPESFYTTLLYDEKREFERKQRLGHHAEFVGVGARRAAGAKSTIETIVESYGHKNAGNSYQIITFRNDDVNLVNASIMELLFDREDDDGEQAAFGLSERKRVLKAFQAPGNHGAGGAEQDLPGGDGGDGGDAVKPKKRSKSGAKGGWRKAVYKKEFRQKGKAFQASIQVFKPGMLLMALDSERVDDVEFNTFDTFELVAIVDRYCPSYKRKDAKVEEALVPSSDEAMSYSQSTHRLLKLKALETGSIVEVTYTSELKGLFGGAWCINAYASIGGEYDDVHAIVPPSKHLDYKWMYTVCSRARKRLTLYMTGADKEPIEYFVDAIKKILPPRDGALELVMNVF